MVHRGLHRKKVKQLPQKAWNEYINGRAAHRRPLKGVLKMTKDEVKKELDRIFGEYTDFEDISNALLELPADIVDEIFSE